MFSTDVDLDWDEFDRFLDKLRDAGGAVAYTAPYAIYVEFDTEYEEKPPYQPIFEWVLRNIDTDDPEGVTHAIRNKIYEEGIEGVFFLSRAKASVTDVDDYIDSSEDLVDQPDNVIENILEDVFNKSQKNIREGDAIDTGRMMESGVYTMDVDPENLDEIDIEEQTR